MNIKRILISAAFFASTALGAQAATISLGANDFTYTGGSIQSGNCPIAAPCIKLNKTDELTITYSGGPFSITGFSYTLQGNPSSFELVGGMSQLYTSTAWSNPSTQIYTAVVNTPEFSQFKIKPTGTGTFRIGGFTGAAPMPMSAVPLPAAGMLLLTALGGFAAFGRRKA
jgi:hypothetical protein